MIDRLRQGVDRTVKYYRNEDPVTATKRVTYDAHAETVRLLFDRFEDDVGVPVYERDWDVLVILDACRVDLMDEVACDHRDEYPFLEPYSRHTSLGSNSGEWLESNFTDEFAEEKAETAMVTGNPHTGTYLDAEDFLLLDEVWRYGWEDEDELFEPRYITDRAVSVKRNLDPDRLVVHYMQPHHPFVPEPLSDDDGLARSSTHNNPTNPWVLLRRGDLTADRVWNAYEANLRYVLDEVETLLANIDGRVAITADHGNLFGEWGLYGHPVHTPIPALLAVPWAETTGHDDRTRNPELTPPESLPVTRVYRVDGDQDHLDALGYV